MLILLDAPTSSEGSNFSPRISGPFTREDNAAIHQRSRAVAIQQPDGVVQSIVPFSHIGVPLSPSRADFSAARLVP
jgi:hypothetical protein